MLRAECVHVLYELLRPMSERRYAEMHDLKKELSYSNLFFMLMEIFHCFIQFDVIGLFVLTAHIL